MNEIKSAPKKILLDTDIGSDIDDAICLAYLLAQPACDLLGITTVTGEPHTRARLASAICQVAGRDIPIYPGAGDPLLIKQQQPQAPQAAALNAWPHQQNFPTGQAIDFMRQTIRANPHEVTLLAIGPLTNVALLFATDPEIPSLLKELIMMCGVFTPHLPTGKETLEWNAKLDAHASAIVYNADVPIHCSVGLDVTTHVTMDANTVREQFKTPLLRPVLDFAEVWFQHSKRIVFHDPLAAVAIFEPEVCQWSHGQVTVELDDKTRLGQTIWQPGDGPHQVALGVDADSFFENYFGILNA